jgi:deoxycytidine triphosphate deaminase
MMKRRFPRREIANMARTTTLAREGEHTAHATFIEPGYRFGISSRPTWAEFIGA